MKQAYGDAVTERVNLIDLGELGRIFQFWVVRHSTLMVVCRRDDVCTQAWLLPGPAEMVGDVDGDGMPEFMSWGTGDRENTQLLIRVAPTPAVLATRPLPESTKGLMEEAHEKRKLQDKLALGKKEDAEETPCPALSSDDYSTPLLVWPSSSSGRAHFYRQKAGRWAEEKNYVVAGDAVFARYNAANLPGSKSKGLAPEIGQHLCVWYRSAQGKGIAGWLRRDELRGSDKWESLLGQLPGKADWPYTAETGGEAASQMTVLHADPDGDHILCLSVEEVGYSCHEIGKNQRVASNVVPTADCGGETLLLFNNGIEFEANGTGCYGNHGQGDHSGFYLSSSGKREDCRQKKALADQFLCEVPEQAKKDQDLSLLYQSLVALKKPFLSELPANQKVWLAKRTDITKETGSQAEWELREDRFERLQNEIFMRKFFLDRLLTLSRMTASCSNEQRRSLNGFHDELAKANMPSATAYLAKMCP